MQEPTTRQEESLMPGSKVFVTGGTGFIGSYIIRRLVEDGFSVTSFKRQSPLPFYIPEEILQKVHWLSGDVLDVVALADALSDADAVVHSAAIVSFSPHDRQLMYKVNVEGTANVVNAAVEARVRRFLHVSSVAALGRTTSGEHVNEQKKWVDTKINTHYAISKRQAEIEVWRGFAEGLNGAIINPSTVLGFGNWHQSSVAIFRNVYKGFPWYTNGVNGFVGVEDVANAAVDLLTSHITEQRFIVSAENWSFEQLFATIAEAFNTRAPHRQATKTLGEIAWRLEKLKSFFTGQKPLLTRETATIAHTRTYFENAALLAALPQFQFTPLREVIFAACEQYLQAINSGKITV